VTVEAAPPSFEITPVAATVSVPVAKIRKPLVLTVTPALTVKFVA